jgi:hypothetical protein
MLAGCLRQMRLNALSASCGSFAAVVSVFCDSLAGQKRVFATSIVYSCTKGAAPQSAADSLLSQIWSSWHGQWFPRTICRTHCMLPQVWYGGRTAVAALQSTADSLSGSDFVKLAWQRRTLLSWQWLPIVGSLADSSNGAHYDGCKVTLALNLEGPLLEPMSQTQCCFCKKKDGYWRTTVCYS